MKALYFYVTVIMIILPWIRTKSVPFIGNPVVENCVACKFIWENIEESLDANRSSNFLDVNTSERNPILASQAFQYFCRIAPDIFYDPCNKMFEKLYFMTQDFCAGKSVKEICICNELCPKEI